MKFPVHGHDNAPKRLSEVPRDFFNTLCELLDIRGRGVQRIRIDAEVTDLPTVEVTYRVRSREWDSQSRQEDR